MKTYGFALCILTVFSRPHLCAGPRDMVPVQVTNLREILSASLNTSCTTIVAVAQRATDWAALVECPSQKSAVVWGEIGTTHAVQLDAAYDRIAIDGDRHLVLRAKAVRRSQATSVPVTRGLILNYDGTLSGTLALNATGAEPINGAALLWSTLTGVFSDDLLRTKPPSREQEYESLDANRKAGQVVYVAATAAGGHITLGSLTETVDAYSADNRLLTSYNLHLEDAYLAIGLPTTPPDIQSGRSRILWGTGGNDGYLYLCLSDTPASGPAYFAVIEPSTGTLSEVRRLQLPAATGRVEERFNPKGVICPARGTVGDHIVIADPEMQIVAIY